MAETGVTPDDRKKQQLREFHRRTKQLLSTDERNYLYNILHDYQTHKQVETLVHHLVISLDSAPKLDLLKDVRNFVPAQHLNRFDRLAPYHKMAHPLKFTSSPYNGTQSLPRPAKQVIQNGHASLPRANLNVNRSNSLYQPALSHKPVNQPMTINGESCHMHAVCIVRQPYDQLGFSIRGGSEHGLGIYVSELDQGSAADSAGLCIGDNIIEVNNIGMASVASSTAVSVLTGNNTLNMIVRRVGKIPGFKFAREKTSWYDTTMNRVIEGNLEDHGQIHHPAGLSYTQSIPDRWVHIHLIHPKQFLGFNIRGGLEYGLGVYVSRVDHGGQAEAKGLKVGDQVLEVNRENFQNISHASAVELLRKSSQLIMRIKEVGKYPAYKEIYAEYSWIDSMTGIVTKSSAGLISSVPVRPASPDSTSEAYTEFPQDSQIDGYNTPQQRMSLPATSQHGHDYTTRETLTLHRPYRQQSVNQSTSNLYGSSQTPKMGLGVSSLKRRQHTRSTPDLHLSQMETYSFHGEMGNEGLIDTYIDSDSDLSRRTGDGQYAEQGGYLTNGSTHSLDIDNDQFFNVNSQFHKYRISNDASQPYSPVHRNDYNSTVNMHEAAMSIEGTSSSGLDSMDDMSGLDALDEVISEQQHQLRPRNHDVVMMERPLELPSQGKGSSRKKSSAPKSKLGVMALQAEALASEAGQEHLRKQEEEMKRQQMQQLKRDQLIAGKHIRSETVGGSTSSSNSKKSRSLREKLFGTGRKMKGDGGISGNKKSRPALSNISFRKKSKSREALNKDDILVIKNEDSVSEIESKARLLLTSDETTAIMRHLHTYQNDQNVLILLAPLCAILDTPQKAGLLIEIESLITDSDLSTYRHAVRKYQETLESRSNRSRSSSLYGSVHSELAPLSINPHSTLDDMYQRADSGLSSLSSSRQYSHSTPNLLDDTPPSPDLRHSGNRDGDGSHYYDDTVIAGGPLDTHVYEIRRPTSVSKIYQSEKVTTTQNNTVVHSTPSPIIKPVHQVSTNRSTVHNQHNVTQDSTGSTILDISEELPQSDYIDSSALLSVYKTDFTREPISNDRKEYHQSSHSHNSSMQSHHSSSRDLSRTQSSEEMFTHNFNESMNSKTSTGASSFSDMDVPGFDAVSIPGDDHNVRLVDIKHAYQDSIPQPVLSTSPGNRGFPSPPPSVISHAESGANSPTFGSYSVSPITTPRRPHKHMNLAIAEDNSELNAGLLGQYVPKREDPPMFIPPPPPDSTPPPLSDDNDWSRLGEWTGESTVESTKSFNHDDYRGSSSANRHTIETTATIENWNQHVLSAEQDEFLTVTVNNEEQPDGTTISIEQDEERKRPTIIQLNKAFKSLGLSVSGGSDCKTQPTIKVQKIFPGGAAEITGKLSEGMQVLSVDGQTLDDLTHSQAVNLFRKSFIDKTVFNMELVVLQ